MKCLIEMEFPDSKKADAAVKALSHEGNANGRSKVKIDKNENAIAIEIIADDVVAMRATANTYLRSLQIFENIEINTGL